MSVMEWISEPFVGPLDRTAWVNRLASLSSKLEAQGFPGLGVRWQADAVAQPAWGVFNAPLAQEMGWAVGASQPPGGIPGGGAGEQASALHVLSGGATWPGMAPFASVYSGHQFGVWAGQLGDGRALLLGEWHSPVHGPLEVQLKGSGATPYSRRGDGRAVLRSSIREYLCSEAMHGLGIPTTRALALTVSPQPVLRETVETAAVVTRVAPSFLRFGHLEHFAYSDEEGAHQVLQALVDFVVEHHFPHVQAASNRALALLDEVVGRTADLIAAWQAVGFCHGVMNTDNMSLLGLTLDYGPFGFMDGFDPGHICNHSDTHGRYSWNNQPQIAFWNLRALAQALVPLIPEVKQDPAPVLDVLQSFEPRFVQAMHRRWRAKLGLQTEQEGDGALAVDWLNLMAQHHADFTITFRRLCGYRASVPPDHPDNAPVRDMFVDRPAFDAWAARYAQRLAQEGSVDAERGLRMQAVNPVYVLRNHMAELAIRRAQAGDFSEVLRLERLLRNPYVEQPGAQTDAGFPPEWARSIEVSCSS